MNEDYLWDKTGSDPEIERLEKALKTFAYKENAAPPIALLPPSASAKIIPFAAKPARKTFRFAYAAAACVAFVAVGLGVWIQTFESETANQNLTKTIAPEKVVIAENKFISENPVSSIAKNSQDLIGEKTENSKRSAKFAVVKIRQTAQPVIRRQAAKTPALKIVKTDVELTKEERFAYDQLMLALSVTSSKLELVKNKVQSKEEKIAASKGGR